ncbi:MAG: hypothetical protein KF764_34745 [Labilithrix sp.]|nr:hypothetical protein [Labilithrix sp.]
MRIARSLLVAACVLSTTLLASAARADDDCPPGSVHKAEDGFTWCEPTVCANDGQCKPNEVCRPMSLCLQVGTLGDAGAVDGGQRLVVTQRCVAGRVPDEPKSCPQKQTCSEMSRCVTKAAAEKMGLLDVASAPTASAPAGAGDEAKAPRCGCDAVGARTKTAEGALAFGLAVSLLAARCTRTRRGPEDRG